MSGRFWASFGHHQSRFLYVRTSFGTNYAVMCSVCFFLRLSKKFFYIHFSIPGFQNCNKKNVCLYVSLSVRYTSVPPTFLCLNIVRFAPKLVRILLGALPMDVFFGFSKFKFLRFLYKYIYIINIYIKLKMLRFV